LNNIKRHLSGIFFLSLFSSLCWTQSAEQFRIADVSYVIEGITREFPLTNAVPIDKKRVFADRGKFDYYLADLRVQLRNQRVFDSTSIDAVYETAGPDGIIPVKLVVRTKDTWNIIALPYPKYDSNDGFLLKLKLKDYNFFGSMQQLNGDVNYAVDNDGKTTFQTNLDFNIPFKAWGYSMEWSNDMTLSFPQHEIPEFDLGTGLNVAVPFGKNTVNFGVNNTLNINDRTDESVLFEDDRYYFNDEFYANVPVTLHVFDYFGNLTWTPSASIGMNWALDGIQHADLQGPVLDWGHSLALGRVDWNGNFRSGLKADLGNSYSFNLHSRGDIGVSVDGSLTGFSSFMDRFGLYGRTSAYYNFHGAISENAGKKIRGILDDRISSDTAFTFNFDLPVRVMTVDFKEITGVEWTKYISFEMQASPFFDMALTHDALTGRYFNPADGWYSGGLEIIVFPAKMRSIYGRISAGFDLVEVVENGGQLGGYAERDGESIRELMIGIGLHY